MAKLISVESLENELRYYQSIASRKTTRRVLEEMEIGIGLHDIINICGLASNSALAERTIKRCLDNDFNKEQVEDILSIYYRLLLYPMLIAGEQNIERESEVMDMNSRIYKETFRRGCINYLGNLPYNLVSNLISLPVLLSNYPSGADLHRTAQMFIEIAEKNKKLADFAEELGYTKDNLTLIINNYLGKMKIGFLELHLMDMNTQEAVTFLNTALHQGA